MESTIVKELRFRYNPVAILFTDTKPTEARRFREKKWGCVVAMYNIVAKLGKRAVFDAGTYGCIGGGVGLCFGDAPYRDNRDFIVNLLHKDERYFKTRDLAEDFVDNFPYIDRPEKYVVFEPLAEVDESAGEPALVSFPCNPDQLAALGTLLQYRRQGIEHVAAPWGSGCQSIVVLPLNEAGKEYPRGIIGNLDSSQRRILPAEIMTFTVPYRTFLEMEEDAEGSFLRTPGWEVIGKRLGAEPGE